MDGTTEQPAGKESASPRQPRPDIATLTTVALCLVVAAAAWFLLRELAALLRPLLLAVFLCYVIIPMHHRLTQRVPKAFSIVVMAGVSVGLLLLLSLMVYGSVVELNEELPRLIERGGEIVNQLRSLMSSRLPAWLVSEGGDAVTIQAQTGARIREATGALVNAAADVLREAVLIAIYLIFLLLEVHRFPARIQSGFAGERAERILAVVGNINDAIASYLKVKVKASLVLAIPALVILWAFGVKFALLWGVLTFLLNFIPYLGSVISCSLPILLAFLQLPLGWEPVAVAVLLVGDHTLSAYLIEPAMTGKAVGLSPLVILASLSFWGLCWGLIGMFLAVPLTVMLKIVLGNVAFTRPFARMLSDE